jgi:uncharacterized glyoxalase superfamily protein PhnB
MDQKPVPTGHQRIIPYLFYADVAAALEFLTAAFGFESRLVHKEPDGRIVHAQVGLGDAVVMMGPAQAQFGFASPRTLPALHSGIVVYVDDVDAHCQRARAAGSTIEREPADQEYGVREYTARDREGNQWFFWSALGDAQREAAPASGA